VLGAALAAVDVSTKHAEISAQMMGLIIAASLVVYSTCVWLFYEAFYLKGWRRWIYPITVFILLCMPFIFNQIGLIVFAMAMSTPSSYVVYLAFLEELPLSNEFCMDDDIQMYRITHF
jgi:hypothetical protein